MILVVGAKNSSNSNRLREIGREDGVPSYLIADGSELDPAWVEGKKPIGLTAGASAPEELVEDVIDALRRIGAGRSVARWTARKRTSNSACRPSFEADRVAPSSAEGVSTWVFRSSRPPRSAPMSSSST